MVVVGHLHLLMSTLDEPANQGSRMKTQRYVEQPLSPSLRLGLSCRRRPLRNQCTMCLSLGAGCWPKELMSLLLALSSYSHSVVSGLGSKSVRAQPGSAHVPETSQAQQLLTHFNKVI